MLPQNARLGMNTILFGRVAFKRFFSEKESGLVVGANSTMDGVFAVGQRGRVDIGDYCSRDKTRGA
jgi:hypothetical protein